MPSQMSLKALSWLMFAANSNALTIPSSSNLKTRQNLGSSPNLAVLGDSWGSGVAYSPFTTYDNNKDFCLRYSQAYGAQLEADKNWADSKTNTMQFVACSGHVLGNIAAGENPQMDRLSGDVDAAILTVGGNNAGFFSVADACIYHTGMDTDYGPMYPDPNGACQQRIGDSDNYINNQFKTDIRNTYNDMLKRKISEDNPDIKFYHTGYAHFFDTRGNETEDWCTKDEVSFNIPRTFAKVPSAPSFLSKELRERINGLTTQVNDAIREVTEESAYSDKFRFIDISSPFDGHRFCELGSNKNAQYYSSDVWLWNVVAPGLGALAEDVGDKPEGYEDMPDFQFGDAPEVTEESIAQEQGAIKLNSDPGNGNSLIFGWMRRPFHPKGQGYLKVKELITERLRADKLPGAIVPERITQDMCETNENSANYDCCANGTCPKE